MMVCTSIITETFEQIVEQLSKAQMAEIRLDQCRIGENELNRIGNLTHEQAIEWIATFRSQDGKGRSWTDAERMKALQQAIDSGANYVDIEIESAVSYRKKLTAYAKTRGCQVIISYHNFENTPSAKVLLNLIEDALNMEADLVKLISTSLSEADNAVILSLYHQKMIPANRLIAFGMSAVGSPTRWQCLQKGAPFTYASVAKGYESAPGQLSAQSIALALKPTLFGIIGKPVAHSMSPILFKAAYPEYENWHFLRIAAQDAKEGIKVMRELKIRGMNVTAPFKSDILEFVDEITESAQKMGAANTLVLEKNGKISAHNTDYLGVLGALKDFKVDCKGKFCLILGAGGAARAAAYALSLENAKTIVINRSATHAQQLARDFGLEWLEYGKINAQALQDLVHRADIIINTLPAGIQLIPEDFLQEHHVVLDASYHDSVYFKASITKKYHFISGLYWLLHQGIPAYTLFTGIRPDAAQMETELLSIDPPVLKNFSFIGLMGSGKSTAALNLSKHFLVKLLDTDRKLEEHWGKKISEVVKEIGIDYLRKEEAAMIPLWLEDFEGMISCGGGVVTQPYLRERLKALSFPIWLYASPKECINRISDLQTRPLLAQAADPLAKIEEIARERFPMYVETAELLVPVGGKEKEEVCNRIALEIEHLTGQH